MTLSNKERQRRYRAKQKALLSSPVTPDTVTDQPEQVQACLPLDIYSERRWSFLRSQGFEWDGNRCRAFRPSKPGEITGHGEVMGVVVPGDPGYHRRVS